MSKEDKTNLSRRNLLKAAAGVAGAAAGTSAIAAPPGIPPGHDEADLVLFNGKIHTMDDQGSVVDTVAIKNGKFVAVGDDMKRAGPTKSGKKMINLRGRTVVPGLVESHTHFVSLANRPGYHVAQWELANSIAEVQAILAARRPDVPAGQFITAMGAGTPGYFAENRLPTLAELDAAVPDRPVFLYQGGGGPARVNTLGKQFFETVTSPLAGPCVVGADGTLAGQINNPPPAPPTPSMANRALYHLRVRQTFEDKMRSALDAMAYTASVGVTSLLDETLVAVATGTLDPASLDPQPTHALFNLNHFRMYDAWLELHRQGKDFVRLQINFLHNQGFITELGDLDHQLPELRERLKNQFPNFGDDLLRTGGIGEWAAPFALPSNANGHAVWREAQRLVAKAGWRNGNAQAGSTVPPASAAVDSIEQVVLAYEAVDAEFASSGGIKHLRWGLQHADHATPDQLARLKALGCGVSMSGFRWNTRNAARADGLPVGARFRQILDSGIPAGLHQDGVHIAAHNPWFALHYATTGLNLPFDPPPPAQHKNPQNINPGQQISRQEAMYAYTRDGAWFMNRDKDFGSIEVGKLADLVVLDKDYFSVSPADMRAIRPIMTVIGGKVVHDTKVLS